MSLYYIIVFIVKGIVYLLNGKPKVIGHENIPDNPMILAATHRSWLDPIYISIIFLPQEIAYMGKKSLFSNPILGSFFKKILAFPVNREKPSTQTIRHAMKVINEERTHLGIFPSGSRYTTELKSGTAYIQRLTKADILPIAIQPPQSFWQFLLRKKGKVAIGQPIRYNPELKYNKEDLRMIDQQIAERFSDLDRQIDPEYVYIPPQKKN